MSDRRRTGGSTLDWPDRSLDVLKATLFDVSPDLICIATTDGYFRMLNRRWEQVLGWSREELCSRPFKEFVHPDDRERTADEVVRLGAEDGYETFQFVNRYLCSDGSYRWLAWSSRADQDGVIYAVARDETEQRRLNEELASRETRLGFLIDEIQRVRELERGRIAGEIHDFALQEMIAALFALSSAATDDPMSNAERRAACMQAHDLVASAARSVRSILQGIAPLHMESQPLAAALTEHAHATQRIWHVPVHVDVELPSTLSPELWLVAYRLTCEAITNAAKHANAGAIHVVGRAEGSSARISIADDGAGIDHRGATGSDRGSGMGLALMQQQVRSIGGSWSLRSSPGVGTTVVFTVPLEMQHDAG